MRPLRLLIPILIVGFWGTMMTWLIRANWNDGNAPFSDMPPLLVFRQILKHEVASNLGIFRGHQRIGSVNITPIHNPANAINLDGNIALSLEGGKAENYNFSLRFDLGEPLFQPHTVTLRLSRRQPPAMNTLIEILLREQKIRYQMRNGDLDLGTQELPLAANALGTLAPGLAGLPPLPLDPAALVHTLELRANRANIVIRGERMDGFRVKIDGAGVTATATLGQLGEIFLLRTSTEYQLLAEGLDPKVYLP